MAVFSADDAPVGGRQLLGSYVAPQWPRVLLLALLLAATIALELAGPQLLRRFIDAATTGAPLAALAPIALFILGVALALQATQLGETAVAANIGLTATNRLRADLTLHVLGLDPAFHAAHAVGALIERTDGDVSTLGNFFARFVVHLAGNALLLVGVLALLFQVDWRVGAVVTVTAALGGALLLGLRPLMIPRAAAVRQASAELFGLIEERLAGAEEVHANGGVAYALRLLLLRSRRLLWANVGATLAGEAAFRGGSLCLRLGTVAALAVAAVLFRQGALSIGTVFLVYAYSGSLQQPIEGLTRQLHDAQQATASIGRVRALLAERSAVVDGPGASLPARPLAVTFEHVTFAYPGGAPVLRDVSFQLAAGEVLGVLGRTGAGKTTLARLLFRLYDPAAGAIRLGSVDLRAPSVAALRARIGLVTQDVQLFPASVRDNVTLFDPAVPDGKIEDALAAVGLGPWLRRQPVGLRTVLAAGGGLSAGEAQLLALARVFLRDPGLVVLDEASSRLDPATERLLAHAIDRLLAGRTAIVIAHRLATVKRADRILILEDGRVVEFGARAALAADTGSRFGRLSHAGRAVEEALS